jgi:hypothetical protein
MGESREAVREALEIEAASVEGVEAARTEQQRGQAALSAELLLESIEKERDSLVLLDQGVDTLKQALDNRRQALEQQERLLQDLIGELRER